MIKKPNYDPYKDGNIFKWILQASQAYRELKRIEHRAIKDTAKKSKKLD